jgi:prepilin-type processing-associated H-X9-DG protein
MRRSAFTLLELLVAFSIIALLIAMLVPAVQYAREAARRAQCASHLHQIGIAMHAYHGDHAQFPPGSSGGAFALHTTLLPYVEQSDLYNHVNFSLTCFAAENTTIRVTAITLFACPSDPSAHLRESDGTVASNYAGNFGTGVVPNGYNGVFRHLRAGGISAKDVSDGLTNTAAVSENLVADGSAQPLRTVWDTPVRLPFDLFTDSCATLSTTPAAVGLFWWRGRPWTYGDAGRTLYNHVLEPNQNSCTNYGDVQGGAYTATSAHSGGVNALFADGTVRFMGSTISRHVWRAIGTRGGGEQESF